MIETIQPKKRVKNSTCGRQTEKTDFFTQNDKFKCWIQHAGSEKMLYLAIYPMPDSQETDRERITQKIISKYKPPCNTD